MKNTPPLRPASLFESETPRRRRARMRRILDALAARYPAAACALLHENPFQLLIATILSAQCTDARVNMVTPVLFAKYPDVHAMAEAPVENIADIIRSTGFFQNKSKNIKACCLAIRERHGGTVPRTMEELTALPGVGRKTANVVLGNAFGVPGFPVDTHVRRIANLLQLTDSENPDRIEEHLCAITPTAEWTDASHRLILHGRETCIARRPRCEECIIRSHCPSAG
ncbi:MAG: endonuclease III [Bacteroidota bacterium]|jgi:endonuclease-3|nr:endonuclease III [Bacteroidota bacterium]